MRFLASFTIANQAETQRRLRELAERDRQVRQRPRH
jgi:predicted transcriptional regulator